MEKIDARSSSDPLTLVMFKCGHWTVVYRTLEECWNGEYLSRYICGPCKIHTDPEFMVGIR